MYLSASEPWPKDVQLFQPYEVEQVLLSDNANCLAVQAFLHMANLDFTIEMRSNVEHMSPSGRVLRFIYLLWSILACKVHFKHWLLLTYGIFFLGKVPFVRANNFVIAELDPIIGFINTKVNKQLSKYRNLLSFSYLEITHTLIILYISRE